MSEAITLSYILEQHKKTKGLGYSELKNSVNELEIRFGTITKVKISKQQYNNVIKKLRACGFYSINLDGSTSLKIYNKKNNIRVEIPGLTLIKKYCKTDSLDGIKCLFMSKSKAIDKDKKVITPIDNKDLNIRISYQTETIHNKEEAIIEELKSDWANLSYKYRLINRVSFKHKSDESIRIDLSIVKSTTDFQRVSMKDINLGKREEIYEIEIELDGEVHDNTEKLLKKYIMFVLSGLQNSQYPIGMLETKSVLDEYLKLINHNGKVTPQQFIGPSSISLQKVNIQNEKSNVPNIRENYTVTDKADGLRKLLFITNNKKVYLLTTNMQVEYTGTIIKDEAFCNTIIDGEHILQDKAGDYQNLYMAFDIYFLKKESMRDLPFVLDEPSEKMRLTQLMKMIKKIKWFKFNGAKAPLNIMCKKFHWGGKSSTIFDACKKVLESEYNYETDGLIFTPKLLSVGASGIGKASALRKITWRESFKWKPPEFNSIDFLVTTKKDKNGNDKIINRFSEGESFKTSNIEKYKELELRVGYNEAQHGILNPCQLIVDNDFSYKKDKKDKKYVPALFYPTNPSDEKAHICYMKLSSNKYKNLVMKTLSNEIFEDNMIVEFSYKNGNWQPLRVRYDKTAELKKYGNNFGNAYHVANDVWYSIHNPITDDILKTGMIKDEIYNIYYNRDKKKTQTINLREFHNKIVKRRLIMGVSKSGDQLIDLSVGKGGDMSKWRDAKLSFVYGIDISSDNINNPHDGACARYINLKRKYKNTPDVMFVKGNTSLNIKDGSAFFTKNDTFINNSIFSLISDSNELPEGLKKVYGKGIKKFNITSCQFSLHYFFENRDVCAGFFKNVVEQTALNGYFIGTCYDGKKIFNLLESKQKGESVKIIKNEKLMWEVIKEYDELQFKNDSSSLGYAINVYQDSINKYYREYLVNFTFLDKLMDNIGFEKVSIIDNLPGVGSFELLSDDKNKLSDEESKISFLNNYFIYQKKHEVDINEILTIMFKESLTRKKKPIKIKRIKLSN